MPLTEQSECQQQMNIDTHSVAPVPLIVFPSGMGLSWIGSGFRLFCMLHTRKTAGAQTHGRWMERAHTHAHTHSQSHTHTHTHALGLVDRDWQEEETHSGAVTSWRDWYFLLNGWMWMIREMKRHKNIYIRLPDGVAALGTAPPLLVTGGITVSTL